MGIPRLDISLPALAAACLLPLHASAQSNLGSANLGSSKIESITVTMVATGTLDKISVRTMGAEELDFTDAGGGSCALGTEYAAKSFCTVRVEFKPRLAGQRRGAVVLFNGKGSVFGNEYLRGTGVGPQAAILTGSGVATGLSAESFADNFNPSLAVDGNDDVLQFGDNSGGFWTISNGTYDRKFMPFGQLTGGNGFAFDGAGGIYVAYLGGTVDRIVPALPGTGVQGSDYNEQFCSAIDLSFPQSVVTDGSGSGYVLSKGGAGGKFSFPSGTCDYSPVNYDDWYAPLVNTISASSLARDATGNAFASIAVVSSDDVTSYSLKEAANEEGTYADSVQILTALSNPRSPVSDGTGNLFVAASADPQDQKDTAEDIFLGVLRPNGSYDPLPVAANHRGPLALDGNGRLFTDGGAYRFDLLNPSAVPFGLAGIGQKGSNRPIRVANTGNAPLLIHALTWPKNFSEAKGTLGECAAGHTVAPGGFCTIAVVFTPVSPLDGGKSQTLSEAIKLVSGSAGGTASEQIVPVTGTETLTIPTVTLESSGDPILPGRTLELTATVKGISGRPAPTGEVTFASPNVSLDHVALKGGKATLSISTLAAGTHTLVAEYGGDSHYAPINSKSISEIVGKAAPKVSIASSANPAAVGAVVTFTATIGGVNGGVVPNGTVIFYDSTAPIGTADLTGGKARLSTSKLAAGKHSILASYSGDALYVAAVGSPLTETIKPK